MARARLESKVDHCVWLAKLPGCRYSCQRCEMTSGRMIARPAIGYGCGRALFALMRVDETAHVGLAVHRTGPGNCISSDPASDPLKP